MHSILKRDGEKTDAKNHGETNGMEVLDKARHSHKQVPSFRYFENVKPVFRELLS